MIKRVACGVMTLEISISHPEKLLNLLWVKKIKIARITRINITTVRIMVNYRDYTIIEEVVNKLKGKIQIVDKKGGIFILNKLKRGITLVIGGFIFLALLYYFSTFVWAIDIKTGENVSPYEVRQNLKSLGIEPGINKRDIDVYSLEEKLETLNSSILWSRARIEGSTLKVVIEEKVNPPIKSELNTGDCVALIGGEIKRIFVASGTSKVERGDFVKEGDILIQGIQGVEGSEYEVPAKGIIIANTFYQREIEVQIDGKSYKKTGRKDKDIYLKLYNKKIYLKKAINNFQYYDKIEDSEELFNTVTYFEKEEVQIKEDRETATLNATSLLENSLLKSLVNTAKIIKKDVVVEDVQNGKIRVKVIFVVEQDIAHTIT